jgi:serine/threonine protein kinase/tetratricopeptide (TPR) repeat protein
LELSPGDLFGRYRIESLVGEGGMGRVYRALDTQVGRHVALKVLRAETAQAETQGAARLVREGRAAAALDHPNVVVVYDVGIIDGTPFVAMELIAGRSLRSFVGDPSVTTARKVRWLRDVARALAAAHARGLVHRDVKPSNILVRDDDVVKVFDFGIARLTRPIAPAGLAAADEPATLTEQGMLIGTPKYMAPEQLRGAAVDGRTDQFAWGVLAYELLTGGSPWKAREDVDVLAAIVLREVEPFASSVADLSPASEAVVLRALSKMPGDRFDSMDELLTALVAGPDPTPTVSRPIEVRAKNPTTMAAPRRLLAAAATAAGMIVTLVAVMAATNTLGRRPSSAPAGAASSSPSTSGAVPSVPTAITDLPLPPTSNAEALSEYRAAIQDQRDGVMASDAQHFHRAITLDPSMAAAHLRIALESFTSDSVGSRREYERATELRGLLSEHDRVLLEAAEAYIRSDPSDEAEYERRLTDAMVRFPGDADFAFWRLRARNGRLGPTTLDDLSSILAIDPGFGGAYGFAAEALAYRDIEVALATVDRCLVMVPGATRCAFMRMVMEQEIGRCAALEADARRVLATYDGWSEPYRSLAAGLYGQGRSIEAAATALEQAREREGGTNGAMQQSDDAYVMAVLSGDFAQAERSAIEEQKRAAPSPARVDHAGAARRLVSLYSEMGRDADAARVASEFLARQEGWSGETRGEDFSIAHDPTPMMLYAARRGGAMNDASFDQRRSEWFLRWTTMMAPPFLPYVWVHGYAAVVETREEAAAALAELPRYAPLPVFAPQTHAAEDIGRVYLLMGETDNAITHLRSAVAACNAIVWPIEHTRAHLDLGQAYEASGDPARACEEYRAVLDRWGSARASRTAQTARARARAAACP